MDQQGSYWVIPCCIQVFLFCFQPRTDMVQPHALPQQLGDLPLVLAPVDVDKFLGTGLQAWNRQALHKSWLSWEVQTRDTERKHLIDQHQRAVKRWTWNQNREFCSELDHIDSSSPSGHFYSVKVKVRKSLTEHEDPFLEVLFLIPPQTDTWMQDPQKVDSGICLS